MSEREPGFAAGARQAAWLFRRARHSPLKVVIGAALLALTVLAIQLIKEHTFGPRFVLRAVEADRDARTAPRPKRQLREYVLGAAFSSSALAGLIEKHGLYPGLYRKNPEAAIESFREDIEVEVHRNYFIEDRGPDEGPRSARIAVSFRSPNRELAVAVTRDLGELIVAREQQTRRLQAEHAAEHAELGIESARDRYLDHKRQMRRLSLEPTTLARVKLSGMARSLDALERDVEIAEQRAATYSLGEKLESKELGLMFEVVERGAVPRSAEIEPHELWALFIITFLFGLPLSALAVGAFSRTVHGRNEVEALGLPLLAEVPFASNWRKA